jgi:hypothetical protein
MIRTGATFADAAPANLSLENSTQRLERIAAARGEKPESVIAELLREADRPAAWTSACH